jgi:hypothetical protein
MLLKKQKRFHANLETHFPSRDISDLYSSVVHLPRIQSYTDMKMIQEYCYSLLGHDTLWTSGHIH